MTIRILRLQILNDYSNENFESEGNVLTMYIQKCILLWLHYFFMLYTLHKPFFFPTNERIFQLLDHSDSLILDVADTWFCSAGPLHSVFVKTNKPINPTKMYLSFG